MIIVEKFQEGADGVVVIDTISGEEIYVQIKEIFYVAIALRNVWNAKKQEVET